MDDGHDPGSRVVHVLQKLFLATAVRDSYQTADLVTKADLREMELRLETKHEALRAELNLIKWMMGSVLVVMLSILVKSFF